MARETLKDFLLSQGIPENSISFNLNNPTGDPILGSEDLGVDPVSEKELLDLDDNSNGLLGDYLKFITDQFDQAFSFEGGNEAAVGGRRGDNLSPAEDQGVVNVFVPAGEAQTTINNLSNGGQFDSSGNPVSSIINKAGDSDNHFLYKDVPGNPLDTSGETLVNQQGNLENDIIKATQDLMLSNNRFANVTGGNAHAEKYTSVESFESQDNFLINTEFGVFNKEKYTSRIEELKDIGKSLLFKASGFDAGSSPSSSSEIVDLENLVNNSDQTSSRYSDSPATSYVPIDVDNLSARNAKGFPENDFGGSSRENRGAFLQSDPGAESRTSFGQTYNSELNFSGKNHRFHKIQAAFACQALMLLAERVYSQVLEYFVFQDRQILENAKEEFVRDNYDKATFGPFILGKSRTLKNFQLDYLKQKILVKTKFPYKTSVERGLRIIFGTSSPDFEKTKNASHVRQAPGFWLSVASSVLKSYDELSNLFENLGDIEKKDAELILNLMDAVRKNKIVSFYNTMATIGDISLDAFDGLSEEEPIEKVRHHRNVDTLPDGPGTRVSKSRKDFGYHDKQLAWSQNEVPSMYSLPVNVIRAATRLDNFVFGANPFRGMIGSELVKNTYFGIDMDGSAAKIPKEVVKGLEDRLDAEYVPFYIQDLRTNEVISFHAFLSSLTDTITPSYTPNTGYGRLDDVQIYSKTSRSITVGFYLISTSKEDFNSMWYKINKFVTLLYPQWSRGTAVSRGDGTKFIQPFSQVMGASPFIRLRIGDVVKSNYSRFALARMFGIGDGDTVATVPADSGNTTLANAINTAQNGLTATLNAIKDISLLALVAVFGSPVQYAALPAVRNAGSGNILASKAVDAAIDAVTELLGNGFVNPFTQGLILQNITDPNATIDFSPDLAGANLLDSLSNLADKTISQKPTSKRGYDSLAQLLLKANNNSGYTEKESGQKIFTTRTFKVRVIEKFTDQYTQVSSDFPFKEDESKVTPNRYKSGHIKYEVKVVDFAAPASLRTKTLICEHSDIIPEPGQILLNTAPISVVLALAGGGIGPAADFALQYASDAVNQTGLGGAVDILRTLYASQETLFMDPFNNPITRAFESNMGRGLPGVINSGITFDWLDMPWEIDHNSRAPQGVKINFTMSVIHDLPPGLDHSGYNRAPLYNVGDIMKNVAGDPHKDNGSMSEFRYRNAGAASTTKTGKK